MDETDRNVTTSTATFVTVPGVPVGDYVFTGQLLLQNPVDNYLDGKIYCTVRVGNTEVYYGLFGGANSGSRWLKYAPFVMSGFIDGLGGDVTVKCFGSNNIAMQVFEATLWLIPVSSGTFS